MSLTTTANVNRYLRVISFLTLLGVSFFPLFKNLGKFQIRMWDEATYANNSIDMLLTNKNIFVVQQLGQPDLYNTKPPLVIWLQALCMKSFGINELSVRLPSAIFGLLTIVLIYLFCVRLLKSKLVGFVSALILLSSQGFISNHVVRTGDLDSILVFFLTLGLLVFIDLIITKPAQTRYHFLIISISLIFGFLTKGIAGFFFLPVLVILSVLYGNYKIYRDKYLYFSAIFIIIMCSSYYIIREAYSPGYFKTVLDTEILRFNKTVMSWQVHPFNYYFENLRTSRFYPFFYFLPLTVLNTIILKFNKLKILIYLLISCIGYFLLISYPAVKLEWYDAPLFPLMSITLGLSFIETGHFILKITKVNLDFFYKEIILWVFAIILLFQPYTSILNKVKYPEENIYSLEFDGAYLKYLKQTKHYLKNLTIFKRESHIEHYDQVLFYKRAYEHEDAYLIRISQETDFNKGDYVMITKPEDLNLLIQNYTVDEIDQWENGHIYLIHERLTR